MPSLRRSLMWNLMSTNGAMLVLFGVSVVLARLLSPEEIGLFSITYVLVSVAQLFRDFGVAAYLQQTKELTRENVGSALGVLITTSWSIAALVFALSWPAAAFYGQAGIRDVMQILALGFIFIPFGSVTHSLLTRDYRAREQSYVRVAGTLTYAVTAVTLALMGFSYMSMAWANLANILVTNLAYLPFRPAIVPWLPSHRGWRKVLRFGAGATLGSSLTALDDGLPDIVLGKLSGPYDVGLLSRAIGTTNLLNRVIGPSVTYAVLPYLSKAHHGGEALAVLLARGSAYITGLMWPAFAATAIFAEPLVRLLFGQKWLEAVPLVQLTCLMFALSTPFRFLGAAFMAVGRPYLSSMPAGLSLVLRGGAIAWLYDGTLASFAIALVAAALLMYPVQAAMQRRYFQLGALQFVKSQAASLHLTAWCTASAMASAYATAGWPDAARLALAGTVVPVVWIVFVWVARHPLRQEVETAVSRVPLAARWLRQP